MGEIEQDYAARAERYGAEADRERLTASRIAALRLVTVVALIILAFSWSRTGLGARTGWLAAAGLAIALGALVRAHRAVRTRIRLLEARRMVCVRSGARVRRDWKALREPAWARATLALPPAADDLRLVGRGSIAQLLDVVTPAIGGERVRAWLLADPPPVATIVARQEGVREIAGRSELLEYGAAAADDASAVPRRTVDAFLAWTGATPSPTGAMSGALAIVGPLLTAAGVIAWLTDALPPSIALGPGVLLNATAALVTQRRLRATLAGVADLPTLLGPVLALIDRWEMEPLQAAVWQDVRTRLRAGGGRAALGRLRHLLAWAEIRYSPMVHWMANALFAVDVHVLRGLDAWRRASGAGAHAWLDALADAEALTALATLAHDNPTWTMPVPVESPAPALEATRLGHPLLPPNAVVGNDVRLEGPGSVLVVTGSNMAGKTTLLRALGVNVILAQAGGPVCASAMRWHRLRVRTSIHVRDALDEGVSLFLAELRRLKGIVDEAAAGATDAPVLALLDEVLHGTNSRDRRAATRAVLAHLHRDGAVTVVTTHDLELADDPALAPATAHLHFREEYLTDANGPHMHFDYVARPGKAVSTNAMALLKALGLD